MKYINREPNYDKYPEIKVNNHDNDAYKGYDEIAKELKTKITSHTILVIDCYPGVDDKELLPQLINSLNPDQVIESKNIFYEGETLTKMMQNHLTEDRVRGIMYYGGLVDFVNQEKLESIKSQVSNTGLVLIYGFGASLIAQADILVYADMARWEIQLRYRKGMPNFNCDNFDEDNLKKYKRGFFVEWRIADKHKVSLFNDIDYYLDTNEKNNPKMVKGEAFLDGLRQTVNRPFRLVPYFDPGVWGGHWMQEVCDLDKSQKNFAWSFDGVPEENSIFLKFGDVRIESPSMNLVKYVPRELLGQKNYARFGAEYPIRFDFLDTMDGQNLSLQVHPLTEYIINKFGMTYTQDESYFILDCKDEGGVYLGLKEGIKKEEMLDELERAQKGKTKFDATKYINFFKAEKFNHFLIPAGTIHCSSSNCMVLEVSATPYIFTFKLWDWDRLGLDGLPRPIHIEDGKQVIQWDRTTNWVKENLVNNFKTIHDGLDYKEVKTGLHELEFIETRLFTQKDKTYHKLENGFNMCNLVDGSGAVIESPTNSFEPYTVHYAETFIIPDKCKEYTIRPLNKNEEIKFIKAYVRN